MTPAAMAGRLRQLSIALSKERMTRIVTALAEARQAAAVDIFKTTVGRKIFKTQNAAVRRIWAPTRIPVTDTGTQMRAYGLAALLEEGGKTQQHLIPKTRAGFSSKTAATKGSSSYKVVGKRLAFMGRGGFIRPGLVRHPGSRVDAHHLVELNLRREIAELGRTMDHAFQGLASSVLGVS